MDIYTNSYCRLCATWLPRNKLTDLEADDEKRYDVVMKLERLNTSVDWSRKDLPETVCGACCDSLESALLFLSSVETAQGYLNDVLSNQFNPKLKEEENKITIEIKNEADDTSAGEDGDDFKYTSDREFSSIKQEDEQKYKSSQTIVEVSKRKLVDRKRRIKKKKRVKRSPSGPKLMWKDYTWTCAACDLLFSTFDEFQAHSVESHGTCNNYRCTDCKKKTFKLAHFLKHVETHVKYLKQSCYKCLAEFSTMIEAKNHKKQDHEGEYMCRGCGSVFPTVEERNTHETKYFLLPEEEKTHKCSHCKTGFANEESLTAHMEKHSVMCDKCGKNFTSKFNLASHLKLHENIKAFQCKMCKQNFKSMRQLRNHVESVHINNKPFTCDKCGRAFRTIGQLKSHSIIHTDKMPFSCTYCDRAFRFKHLLTQHIRQHTGDRPYSCDTCQHDFTNWGNYNKHMKRRHGVDKSKRKRTPNGVLPVNPATGEIITCDETKEIMEWKNEVTTRVRKRN